ncbi:MAG: DNA polymerase III subunit alpha, partial [Acidimicrobiia bacterium]
MADTFAHLHVHTEYSMLDGFSRVGDVVDAVATDHQPAVAITDHGVLYGVADFWHAANRAGVKPIIGLEAYVTPGSRFDRPRAEDNVRWHMTLLAVSDEGYRNLMKLSSRAFLEGYYYKPRIDLELLAEHSAGIVGTSGCLSGPLAHYLAPESSQEAEGRRLERDTTGAETIATTLRDILGTDGFYFELQDHGLPQQRRLNQDLVELSARFGVPLLATNDSHYTRPDEHQGHDLLLCVQTRSVQSETNRLRFDSDQHWVKTAAEMRRLFPSDVFPGACDNTLVVAERSDVDLAFGRHLLPEFSTGDGRTAAEYLRSLVEEGARGRYGDPLPDEVRQRVDYELSVIEDMGFPSYFLIVWDLVRYARERSIRIGPGRGSAAGSIVSYSLRITDLDPLHYGLFFERFLNPGRRQMPDIDLDLDERYRAEMIRYCAERYGSDHVAQIVTFSTIKGRQAVRDAARVLDLPYQLGDRIAKAFPPSILGRDATLEQCLLAPAADADDAVKDYYANAAELRRLYDTDDDARRVIDASKQLEGLRRQASIHAAGVVISPMPLTDIVPVQQLGEDQPVVTQFEFGAIEALGLLKMDLLGLRNLSTISRCLQMIQRNTGHSVDIDSVPLDDPEIYAMLQRGDSTGVFQFEGAGMRSLMRVLRPENFDDLTALSALYRPGPMGQGMHLEYAHRKNGRKPVSYDVAELEPVLRDTYGVLVFQEQVMEVARRIAGFSLPEADDLRKAMGKKIPEVMEQQRGKFVAGCEANGYSEVVGAKLFHYIETFAGYGFNKPHSAAYALVAYQTAWLRLHYPGEYLAALLTSVKRNKDRTAGYLNDCRQLGTVVRVPDVNRSAVDFNAVGGEIIFGLSAIRNVGEAAAEAVIGEREKNGPYSDFADFVGRVDTGVLNKRTVESLIKAGAFDSLGHSRRGLVLTFEDAVDAAVEKRRAEAAGQFSLFDDSSNEDTAAVEPPAEEWQTKTKLAFEREMLGWFVSDHPLFSVQALLGARCDGTVAELLHRSDSEVVTVGGLATGVSRRFTRDGRQMMFFTLEDLTGSVEVMCFPRTVEQLGSFVQEDAVLIVRGRADVSEQGTKIKVQSLEPVALPEDVRVEVRVAAGDVSPPLVDRLKTVLGRHPGTVPVVLHLVGRTGTKQFRLADS